MCFLYTLSEYVSNKQTAGTEKVDLKIKAHADHLHHCQYSCDGTSFFTCGDKAVKVLHVV